MVVVPGMEGCFCEPSDRGFVQFIGDLFRLSFGPRNIGKTLGGNIAGGFFGGKQTDAFIDALRNERPSHESIDRSSLSLFSSPIDEKTRFAAFYPVGIGVGDGSVYLHRHSPLGAFFDLDHSGMDHVAWP